MKTIKKNKIPSPVKFNYESGDSSKKRRNPSTRLKSVDSMLTRDKRNRLQANTRDLTQNFALAGWAVRRHLDYISQFDLQANTGDVGLDRDIEAMMEWYQRPQNCDVSRRHSFASIVRMCEERRTIDGDVFLVKMSSGHLQVIESDRVRDPDQISPENQGKIVHGVKVSPSGMLKAISVHSRDDRRGYEFERSVRAENVFHFGYFDRFDQIRGVSPLAPAVATFRDIAESSEYALQKMKVQSLFALVFYRDSSDNFGDYEASSGYEVDFGKNGGAVKLDLEPNDRAEFLESKSPANEFQSFLDHSIGMALKCLDIPISFADESRVNYSSARSAWIHYERSTRSKRRSLRDLLDRITYWRMKLFIQDGDLRLPRGMDLSAVRWEWVHSGTPWVDPKKEVEGDILAIAAGLKTRSQVVKERHGKEFRDVAEQLASEQRLLEELGVDTALNKVLDLSGEDNEE